MKQSRFFLWFLTATVLLMLPPGILAQAPQKESLAEAARRLREQKQSSGSPRVITNDHLAAGTPILTSAEPGEGSAASASSGESGTAAPRAVSEEEEKERAEAEQAVRQEKARLEQLKRDLELLERDADLARQQFYSNPAYANDSAGQRRINDQLAQVASKKSELAASEASLKEAEARLKEVEERLGPRQQEPLTPEEQRGQWAERLRPLQQELAQVEAEIQRMRAQLPNSPAPAEGNDFTRNQIRNLEARRAELQRKISDIQDEARRAGVPAGWTRPPQ
jgi:chromosome segregation ATPase